MSIRISSNIHRSRIARTQVWIVATAASDPEAAPSRRYIDGDSDFAASFPEALALASAQRAELHAKLMDAVHDSQAARREARAAQLAAELDTMDCPLCTPLTGPTMRCTTCDGIDMMHAATHPHPALHSWEPCTAFTTGEHA